MRIAVQREKEAAAMSLAIVPLEEGENITAWLAKADEIDPESNGIAVVGSIAGENGSMASGYVINNHNFSLMLDMNATTEKEQKRGCRMGMSLVECETQE